MDGAGALNEDLQRLTNCAEQWMVKFSPTKTKSLLLTRKKGNDPVPPVMMDGSVLEDVTSYKHIGITLSNDVNWGEHIEPMTTSSSKFLDVLNGHKPDQVKLERLYVSLIRSKLE